MLLKTKLSIGTCGSGTGSGSSTGNDNIQYPSYYPGHYYPTGSKVTYLGINYKATYGTTETSGNGDAWIQIGTFQFINIGLQKNEVIEINVEEELTLGQQLQINYSNAFNPLNVKIYSNQTTLITGQSANLSGVYTFPNAEFELSQSIILKGMIYCKNFHLKDYAKVYRPSTIDDIWHSHWNYAPPFDPAITNYTSLVGLDESVVKIEPISNNPNISVKVDGNAPLNELFLGVTDKTFVIDAINTDSDNVDSKYHLMITRTGNNVIYVDDNSEANVPEYENQWYTLNSELDYNQ